MKKINDSKINLSNYKKNNEKNIKLSYNKKMWYLLKE